jgi:hypothetical protein
LHIHVLNTPSGPNSQSKHCHEPGMPRPL